MCDCLTSYLLIGSRGKLGAPVHGEADSEPDRGCVADGRKIVRQTMVDGEADSEPDRGCVADGRKIVRQTMVDVAPGVRHKLGGALQRVEVHIAGQRPQPGQHVRLCHRQKDEVGRRATARSTCPTAPSREG